MMMKKIAFVTSLICLLNILVLSSAFANPILTADKAQLQKWRIGPQNIGIPEKAMATALHEYSGGIVWRLNHENNVKITLEEFLSPATKIHIKKEYGLEITEEDRAMAAKKWSANPLLEVNNDTLKRWLKGSVCKQAYTEPNQANFDEINGNLELCTRKAIPKIMLDTGVRPAPEVFMDPQVISKAKEVFK